MSQTYTGYFESPIGLLRVVCSEKALLSLDFVDQRGQQNTTSCALLEESLTQLKAYFDGNLKQFSLPVEPDGTPFQKGVWHALQKVKFGATTSYGAIAQSIGNPKSVRAVGAANGSNPIAIVIPCHRIIGSNGKLTGYGGGLWRKEWLLSHEQPQGQLSLDHN
jgi:methylated-DNA-[protein]-cysteine S-methyltransferase